MIGSVAMNEGSDLLDTRAGTLQGDVDLGGGNDTAYGSAAADSIQGGTENDVIRGGSGKDSLDGGAGTQDYIDLSDKIAKVEITLLGPNVSGSAKVNGVVEDTFVNFEAVIGGSAGDLLTGNSGSNNIAGGSGNDTAVGGLGNDTVFGGNGNDLIAGGLGNDQLTGTPTLISSASTLRCRLQPMSTRSPTSRTPTIPSSSTTRSLRRSPRPGPPPSSKPLRPVTSQPR
jgi:Ca2+-binding RTX toxin-like protein